MLVWGCHTYNVLFRQCHVEMWHLGQDLGKVERSELCLWEEHSRQRDEGAAVCILSSMVTE